ncbi:MAG: chemotaxis protein CheX, partial [bacterium]
LLIEVPIECCRLLAGEAYGDLEIEPSIEQMQDLVGEIINTVAGRFLDELVPSGKMFQLGLPEKGQGEPPHHSDEITSILLNVGDHYVNTTVVGKDFEIV